MKQKHHMSFKKKTSGFSRAGRVVELRVSESQTFSLGALSVFDWGVCLLIIIGDNYIPPVNNEPCELPVTLPFKSQLSIRSLHFH